jgi:hypothetical protein
MDELSSNVALQNSLPSQQNVYRNAYQITLGPQLVNIKTSYREITEQKPSMTVDPVAANLQRYFDVRATSALQGTSLVGHGEMAYGVFNSSAEGMRPAMLRFGLSNRWRDLGYGAEYKSVTKGFMPIAGPMADQSRDEASIWAEHGLGPFRLRGTVGEFWEPLGGNADFRITRIAGATLQINRARWGGSLSSSYGLIGQGLNFNEDRAFYFNRFTTSYRPIEFLLLEPNFSLREEWNQSSGVRTQTPASGFAFSYAPRGTSFRLVGGTTFSRTFNNDGSNDVSIHGTSAGVDWRLGEFFGRNDTLSFTFNYDRQLDHLFRANSRDGLSGMLQFKIIGF